MSTKITKEVYLLKDIRHGGDSVSCWDWSKNSDPPEYLVLSMAAVEFVVDMAEGDVIAAQVDALQKEIQKERADAQVRVQAIEDRIQSLLSITHQAEA